MALNLNHQLHGVAATNLLLCRGRKHFSGFALLARQGNKTLQTRFDRIA